MSTNLYQRYFWLINTIYRSKQITLNEINQKWLESSLSNGTIIPERLSTTTETQLKRYSI